MQLPSPQVNSSVSHLPGSVQYEAMCLISKDLLGKATKGKVLQFDFIIAMIFEEAKQKCKCEF